MKICLNCGDKLLDGAKKCPFCGVKAKDFPIVDLSNKKQIEEIISSVPNPKSGMPKWISDVETRQNIWSNSKSGIRQQTKSRIETAKSQGLAHCPKCGSTSITYVSKKLSISRAVAGGVIANDAGAVLGGLSSKKGRNKCQNCGHSWKI